MAGPAVALPLAFRLTAAAAGCAVMTLIARGRWSATLACAVNLVRAPALGHEVEVVAIVSHLGSHMGRSTATAGATLKGAADGRLYATGSTSCLVMGGD
jgi:acyl-coenzyme A thioesterase PaaI-like protein